MDRNYIPRPRNKCRVTRVVLLFALATSLSACGIKGGLKTPNQIERQEAKEARRAQKEITKQEDAKKLDSEKEFMEKK